MCRLFGLHAGAAVDAEFWLIDAPDSLSAQSRHNPDGAGIGVFGADGKPTVSKQPIAAWQDTEFAAMARRLRGTTFVAHVRYASTGEHTVANTHPFLEDGRLFAHNGVVQGLADLDRRLSELDAADLVRGETDSERVFALITAETRRHGGDLARGITAAIGWISDQLPVYAVNLVLATATELWALRYPATHELYVLHRPAGGTGTSTALEAASTRIRATSPHLADRPSVIIASERMDGDPAWRLLDPGELLHVSQNLEIVSSTPFPAVPHHLLQRSDLDPATAASQHPQAPPRSSPA
ncbi:MAG TPA: class II glutamine amidotransferase [Streptosporangiaceae bacterium]|jgi:glutamine amidotransferase|nr:class II glutamine amidotransferase [Streptosporangiaceae bacterium]